MTGSRVVSIERVRNWWDNVQSSLWFLPAGFGVLAVALSFIVPEIDSRVEDELTRHQEWLFFGTANSARSILSAIASSLITVITLLFSITMLTLQQASTQYTPRIIRAFMRDRGVQVVLATFLATFLYALLVLRQVRGEDGDLASSVPMLSVSLAIVLTVVCLGMLIFFIHHIATMFQASTIIERIHHEMRESINELFPDSIGAGDDEEMTLDTFRDRYATGHSTLVRSQSPGYLRRIDDHAILDALGPSGWCIVVPLTGTYVIEGHPLVEAGGVDLDDDRVTQLCQAFVLDHERTMAQDNLFGIRQLVDIALKALSPSIHDPTTAEHVISALGDIIAVLSRRAFPSPLRVLRDDGSGQEMHIWVNRPDFDAYLDAAFSQISQVASSNVHVLDHLLTTLADLVEQTEGKRRDDVRREMERIVRRIEAADITPEDFARLRTTARV